jgi:hypothetical protein
MASQGLDHGAKSRGFNAQREYLRPVHKCDALPHFALSVLECKIFCIHLHKIQLNEATRVLPSPPLRPHAGAPIRIPKRHIDDWTTLTGGLVFGASQAT